MINAGIANAIRVAVRLIGIGIPDAVIRHAGRNAWRAIVVKVVLIRINVGPDEKVDAVSGDRINNISEIQDDVGTPGMGRGAILDREPTGALRINFTQEVRHFIVVDQGIAAQVTSKHPVSAITAGAGKRGNRIAV